MNPEDVRGLQSAATDLLIAASKGPNDVADILAEAAVQAIEERMGSKMPEGVREFVRRVVGNSTLQMALAVKRAYDISGAEPVFKVKWGEGEEPA